MFQRLKIARENEIALEKEKSEYEIKLRKKFEKVRIHIIDSNLTGSLIKKM